MNHYKSFIIYTISFLALFFVSFQGIASQGIARKGKWEILDLLAYPAKDGLNLNSLDKMNLKGSGQILGVVDSGVGKHLPGSLQGKVVNDTSSIINADDVEGSHGVMVAQVAVSKHAGLAPDAKVFLGSDQIKIADAILVDIPDAIKFAIRNGADAINLSIMSLDKDKRSSSRPSSKRREGKATYAFLEGIEYALDKGIPVFIAAGNDKEEIDGKVLKSICERAETTKHPELLFIVGGFDYKSEIFARKDVTFAEHSGRAKSENDYSKFLVVGPYKIKVEKFLSIEDRKKELHEFRVACDAPKFIRNWTQDLQNALELANNPELTARISPLLTQLEEQQLYLANYKNNAAKKQMLKEIEEELKKLGDARLYTSIGKKILGFHQNLGTLKLEFMTGEMHIDPRERLKIAPQRPGFAPDKVNGIFEEGIMHIHRGSDGTQILPEIAFELVEVEGTSFSSPAVASVYLRLNQYRKTAVFLNPEDIAVSMKATAYKKAVFEEGEEPGWYGCGVIDAGAAFKLCEKIAQARLSFARGEYLLSVDYWMNIFDTIAPRYPLPANYYFEILEAYKATGQYKRAEGNSRQALLRSFLEKVLAYYPTYYATHAQDRLEGILLYELGKYEECKAKFNNILDEINRSENKTDDNGLDRTIFDKARWFGVLLESDKQMSLWFKGFLTFEKTSVEEDPNGAKIAFLTSSSSREKARYSIRIRNGDKILQNLLTNIDEGLNTQYNSLTPLEKWILLNIAKSNLNPDGEIVDLPKGMPQEIERLKVHVQKMPHTYDF